MPLADPLPPTRHVLQTVEAQGPEKTFTFLCALELSGQNIAMAGLTVDGLSLFNIAYDGRTLKQEKSPLLLETIDAQYILKDLQFAYWPVDALRKILPVGWHIETTAHTRALYRGDEKISVARYPANAAPWPESVELINYRYGYRLQIKTLNYDAVSE